VAARVLIAGAGDVGTRAGLLLAQAGKQVFALKRRTVGLPAELVAVAADLTRPETLTALPQDIDSLVYCAAADGSNDEAYQNAYVAGLNNVLQSLSLQRAPLQRVLFVSSTAVYAQTNGEWVTEESTAEPEHFSGIRTLQAESVLEHFPVASVVVRSGGIYGPGRTRLIDQVRSGTATYDPTHAEYGNRIHAQDLARAIVHLLDVSEPLRVYNAVDQEPAPRREVLQWLASQLGVAPPTAAADAGAQTKARRTKPSDKRVDSSKLRASGYQFQFPSYREGYGALLAESAAPATRP
jgi:nucleoside-diphosphate-sugar epimerase